VRERLAEHGRLAAAHGGVTAADEHLAAFEALTPDEYQDQIYARMPVLAQAAPTLASKIEEYQAVSGVRSRRIYG
jgi:hypothetical protein